MKVVNVSITLRKDIATSYLFCRPIVQIVGNIMTLATFREALMHAFGVRQTMAVSTLRHGLVLVGMTGCTSNLAMLGLTRGERRKDRVVTCSTKL